MNTIKNIIKILILAGLAFLLVWLGGFVAFFSKVNSWKPSLTDQNTDAIVILTGGKGRLKAGLDLFAARRGSYMFITGIHSAFQSSDVRKLWRGRTELPTCCIILDYKAQTTAQNALMTREWIKAHNASALDYGDISPRPYPQVRSIRLVTSNYHMPRAVIDFQRILPDIQIIPHPMKSRNTHVSNPIYWLLLLKEYNKYLLRVMQGWLPTFVQGVFA